MIRYPRGLLSLSTPPQVLGHNYDIRADLWSTGVLLYILLCGETPFFGSSPDEILDHVKTGRQPSILCGRQYHPTHSMALCQICHGPATVGGGAYSTALNCDAHQVAVHVCRQVSPMAKNLVEQLICFDPSKRLTAAEVRTMVDMRAIQDLVIYACMHALQALNHPWIVREGDGREEPLYGAVSAMRAFNSHRKLKRAVLGVMAQILDHGDLQELQKVPPASHSPTGVVARWGAFGVRTH